MTTAFAALHRAGTPLLLPNAWDYASGAALARLGFAAIGTTSLGVAASAGLPDGAAATCSETLTLARNLGQGQFLLSVDIEAGFSEDPAAMAEFTCELAAAGAVGINLEDGRSDGTLASADRHAAKIAAVKAAVPDLFVNARTDTYWLAVRESETLPRLDTYQQAGADGVFVPGLSDPKQIATLVDRLGIPLNILYSPSGPCLADLGGLGVARVSVGSLLFRVALRAALDAVTDIRANRPITGNAPTHGQVQELSRRL